MTICLVDTSVLCEIIEVPNVSCDPEAAQGALAQKIQSDERLMLPMATIFETGNHIGQNGDGQRRRRAGERFVDLITGAVQGVNPFTATRFLEREELLSWLADFPNWVTRSDKKGKGSGLGDLSITKEWAEQCARHHGKRRIYIWSLDIHLAGYDNHPP